MQEMSVKMRSVRIILLFALVAFVPACGGGGGGSSDSTTSGDSGSGGSTTSSMDATGLAIAEAFLAGTTSQAGGISSTVGGVATGGISRTNALIDILPVITGGTLTGATVYYVDQRTPGTFSGYTSLDGRVVASGDMSSGDGEAQSEGLTRSYANFTNADSSRWTFNGVLDKDLTGVLVSGILQGSITSTLGSDGFSVSDNDNGGEVYIFDDMMIQVNLWGTSDSQNVACAAGGISFFTLHKALGGPFMTCFLNADCTSCI